MRSMTVWATLLLATGGGVPVAWAGLELGDPAPAFGKKIEWLKGGPINPTKGAGREIYVLEFWALWCQPCLVQIPHITELQHKYGKHGVRFVGLTSVGSGWQRQRVDDIKQFVKGRGDQMAYEVGFDPTEVTDKNYLGAVGATGIPYAFIVDRNGKIAWHGHPEAQMEEVLDEMVAGRFSLAKARAMAKTKKQLDELMMQLNFAVSAGQWERCLALLGEMLQVDEANMIGIQFSLGILNDQLRDHARVRLWTEDYMRDHKDSAAGLCVVAETHMSFAQLGDRHPDLALASAAAACGADDKSLKAMQVHARALHQIGRIDQAIEWQEKALAIADNDNREQVRRTLEFYRTCKVLAKL